MDIIFDIKNPVGYISLNRPHALNAINYHMATQLYHTLLEWAEDPAVQVVVIQGTGGKAFSAGGDIKEIYTLYHQEKGDVLEDFFEKEYVLDALIHNYPKPYVALMDGITLGGGMGLSIHGSHRVVTENSVLAMPENRIGFFPDVGAAYFLNQCPGHLGMFLALTGYHLSPADALFTGLATHAIPSSLIPKVLAAFESSDLAKNPYEGLSDILEAHMDPTPQESLLGHHRHQIDQIFSLGSVEEILEEIRTQKDKFWYQILDHLETLSPVSLKVTHKLMKWAVGKPLVEIIKMDYHLSQKFLKGPNFMEGIRARLIDKDNSPHWDPPTLEEVTREMIEDYFPWRKNQ